MPTLWSPRLCHSRKCLKAKWLSFFLYVDNPYVQYDMAAASSLPSELRKSGYCQVLGAISWHLGVLPSICLLKWFLPRSCSNCNPSASSLFPLFYLCLKNYVIYAPNLSFSHLHSDFEFQDHWLGFRGGCWFLIFLILFSTGKPNLFS